MTNIKYTNVENLYKGVLTTEELKIIKFKDWNLFTEGMLPDGASFQRKAPYVYTYSIHLPTKAIREAAKKACRKRASELRRRIQETLKAKKVETISAYFSAIKEEKKQMEKENKARKAKYDKRVRERKAIIEMIASDGSSLCNVMNALKLGAHYQTSCEYSGQNGIDYWEDEEKYSSRCTFMKVTRHFTLQIKRGWHVLPIGGLITFVKGGIKREGQPCEWIEQGREMSDIKKVKGYLVRGEHIEAKSLVAAKRINAEHRSKMLARTLKARAEQTIKIAKINERMRTARITFEDSIAAGNCHPGTARFKELYEQAVGHEATDISIADLRKYSRQFGVEFYAERVIQYVINK